MSVLFEQRKKRRSEQDLRKEEGDEQRDLAALPSDFFETPPEGFTPGIKIRNLRKVIGMANIFVSFIIITLTETWPDTSFGTGTETWTTGSKDTAEVFILEQGQGSSA